MMGRALLVLCLLRLLPLRWWCCARGMGSALAGVCHRFYWSASLVCCDIAEATLKQVVARLSDVSSGRVGHLMC
jgi:hypothetical protein